MTDLKYTPLTFAVRDAVVAWLDTDPTMARLTAGDADARALASAYERLLPVLAATLHVARVTPPSGVSGPQYTYTGSNVLQTSHDDLQRRLIERDVEIAGLRDHLSRETKSSEAASGIADELSIVLNKSREQVYELEAEVRAFRVLREDEDRVAVATVEGYEKQLGDLRALVAERDVLRRALEGCREAIEGCNDIDDLLHMRDMIGLACNNAGLHRAVHPAEGPVYRWAADQGTPRPLVPEDELRLGAARIRELEAALNAERQQHARDVEDLRDRMADPEGMAYALMQHTGPR
jgi:hypothetical protein